MVVTPLGGKTRGAVVAHENITESKRVEAELRSSREQLRALATSLSRAEQEERCRIASLLHDELIQSLALARIKLGALRARLDSPEQIAMLDAARTPLEDVIGNIRSMVFQLNPPILSELGLEASLAWLAEQFRTDHGLECRFHADAREGRLDAGALDEETRNMVFAAVRELLINVVKHARAGRASIVTRVAGGTLGITVEDDGVGFEPRPAGTAPVRTGGFGLLNINERLGYLGGRCEVDSRPGCGTRVVLSLPLKPA